MRAQYTNVQPVVSPSTLADVLCVLTVLVTVVAAIVPSDSRGDTAGGASGESHVAGCPQCLTVGDKELAAQLKMEAIKRQILSKLSLTAKPNITSPPPREVVLEVLRRSGGTGKGDSIEYFGDENRKEDDYYARTSEIMAFAEPGATLNGHTLLDLHHPHDSPHKLRVLGATLWVQLRHKPNLSPEAINSLRNKTVTLYVLRATANQSSHHHHHHHSSTATLSSTAVYSSTSLSEAPLNLDLVSLQKVTLTHVGWKKINLLNETKRWFSNSPATKLTLLVDCTGCEPWVELDLFKGSHFESNASTRRIRHRKFTQSLVDVGPFLSIHTETVKRRRNKRHIITCNSLTTTCCKQNLYVSFKELGWDDWIIAPKGYYANYCMGDCVKGPRLPDSFAHFHTHVIEEYRNRNPFASIAPCCAPTRLSSMSLIYFDTELNIIKTDLPKMIVEECGCT